MVVQDKMNKALRLRACQRLARLRNAFCLHIVRVMLEMRQILLLRRACVRI